MNSLKTLHGVSAGQERTFTCEVPNRLARVTGFRPNAGWRQELPSLLSHRSSRLERVEWTHDHSLANQIHHAGTSANLRALQYTVAARFTRGAHLLVRMYVLRGMRHGRVTQCLPQLRRRLRAKASQTVEELERRELSRQGPCEHDDPASAG